MPCRLRRATRAGYRPARPGPSNRPAPGSAPQGCGLLNRCAFGRGQDRTKRTRSALLSWPECRRMSPRACKLQKTEMCPTKKRGAVEVYPDAPVGWRATSKGGVGMQGGRSVPVVADLEVCKPKGRRPRYRREDGRRVRPRMDGLRPGT